MIEIVRVDDGVVVLTVSYECFREFGINMTGYYARWKEE